MIRREACQIGSAWGDDIEWIEECVFEYSYRMSRSLGLTYPERSLIRLNVVLREQAAIRRAVLCHELAHVLCFRRLGRSEPAHGEEWKKLVTAGGGDPYTRLFAPDLPTQTKNATPHFYRHYCPFCQASRTARRRMHNWRCEQCVSQGLGGKLVIERIG